MRLTSGTDAQGSLVFLPLVNGPSSKAYASNTFLGELGLGSNLSVD